MWPLTWRFLFFTKNNGDKFTTSCPEKDLLDILIEKTKTLGHMLTFEEASDDPDMIVPNSYAYYFGSFSVAASMAWSRVRALNGDHGVLMRNYHPPKIPEVRQTTENLYKKEVNFMNELQENKRKKRERYTIADVEDALRRFYDKTGRLPSQADTCGSDILPSWTVLVKYLGPKSNWQAVVGEASPLVKQNATKNEEQPADVLEAEDEHDVASKIIAKDDGDAQDEQSLQQSENVKIETSHKEHNDFANIEIKITLPDREKPILISLTV